MNKRNTITLGIIVVIATMFYRLSPMIAEQDTVHRMFAPLVEVDALVQRHFVHSPSERALVEGAVHGMMMQLDPYSGYIAPDQMADFKRRHSGEYVGVGLVLGMSHERVVVIAPVERGAGTRAGIRSGDTILAVDGRSTEELSVLDVENLLAGLPGSSVALTILRPPGRRMQHSLVRSRVKHAGVCGIRRLPRQRWDYRVSPAHRIAYLRIARFSEGVIQDVDAALDEIERQGCQGLVIDLRFNPGGLMPQAIALVDRFVDSGTILTTIRRRQSIDTFAATAPFTDTTTPLAILINGGSASSSEIVAGSLQDHGRALIVGERSFGKGSVQDFIMLDDGLSGIKITVAYYQLPSGRIIHRTPENVGSDQWGILPTVEVSLDDAEYDAIIESRRLVDAAPSPEEQRDLRTLPTLLIDRQLQAAIEALIDEANKNGGSVQ